MFSVRYILTGIAEMFTHFSWQMITITLLKQITYTTLARLGIYSDNICIICSSDILRIDGNIRNGPFMQMIAGSVFHPLGNRILM